MTQTTRVEEKQNRFLQYVKRRAFLGELLTFFVALLLGRICIAGDIAPFGLAFLAAASISGCNAHYALAGAVFGEILLQTEPQYPAVCACVLYYVMHLLWNCWSRKNAKLDQLFLLFLAQAALLPVFYAGDVPTLLRALINIGLCEFSALAMQSALRTLRMLGNRHVLSDAEQVSISLFFGILLLAVTDVQAFGFSLPVVLLLVFAMIAALARGVSGVAVSVALGVVLTVGGDFTLMFVGSLAACTLAGSLMRRMDTIGVFGGFLACSLVAGTYVYTASHTINLLNLAVSGAVFLLIPRTYLLALCAYLDADKNRERFSEKAMKRMKEHTARDIRQTVSVCREVARLFEVPGEQQEPADAQMQWTAQAAASVCMDCSLRKMCWRDPRLAAQAVSAMLQAHERGERIRIRRPFDPSCKHMPQMAAAAWQAQNQYLVQSALRQQTARQYQFVNRQLVGICDVIETLAQRVSEECWLDEDLERGVAQSLDRHGIRVFGVDASFPHGKLRLDVRVSATYVDQPLPVCEAVRAAIRRPVSVLSARKEGRQGLLVLEEAQPLRAVMGTASAPISRSGVSGDSTGERRLPMGRVLYAISDGMGAGESARSESQAAIRLLFDLYDSGFSRDVALESVNRLLLKREQDMYATLDALYLNLRSGQAEFIKCGAPPTFVYRADCLHTVSAEALPAGIVDEATPAIQRARIRKNDAIIMFSDGALDALGERTQQAICEALDDVPDSQTAADRLLEAALASGAEDDMTVMVIQIA